MTPIDFRSRKLPTKFSQRIVGGSTITNPGYNVLPSPGQNWGSLTQLSASGLNYAAWQLAAVAASLSNIPAVPGSLLIEECYFDLFDVGSSSAPQGMISFLLNAGTSISSAGHLATVTSTPATLPFYSYGASLSTSGVSTDSGSPGSISLPKGNIFSTDITDLNLVVDSDATFESSITGNAYLPASSGGASVVISAFGLVVAQYQVAISQWDLPDPLVNDTNVEWLWRQGDSYIPPSSVSSFTSRRIHFSIKRPIIIGPGQALTLCVRLGNGSVGYVLFAQTFGRYLP